MGQINEKSHYATLISSLNKELSGTKVGKQLTPDNIYLLNIIYKLLNDYYLKIDDCEKRKLLDLYNILLYNSKNICINNPYEEYSLQKANKTIQAKITDCNNSNIDHNNNNNNNNTFCNQDNFVKLLPIDFDNLPFTETLKESICSYYDNNIYTKKDTDAAILIEVNIENTDAEIIVEEPIIVDCQVSEWGEWSPCQLNGTRTRTRTIITSPENGGSACPVLTETGSCTPDPTPIDCELSEWGDWSDCSIDGTQTRTRTIITDPFAGGQACGPMSETRSCTYLAPQNCVLSDWGEWINDADGYQTSFRTVVTPASNGGTCIGSLRRTRLTPVNCKFSEWGEWGPCENQIQIRTRTIISPASNGGTCIGATTESRECTPISNRYSVSGYTDTCSETTVEAWRDSETGITYTAQYGGSLLTATIYIFAGRGGVDNVWDFERIEDGVILQTGSVTSTCAPS